MNNLYLRDERCHAVADPLGVAAEREPVPERFVSNGPWPPPVKVPLASAGTRKRSVDAVRWVVLVGAIVLGLHSIARGLASLDERVAENGAPGNALRHRFEHSSPGGDLRPGSHSGHRWHKRSHKFPKSMMANDPSDDGTSSDPGDDDDDDASDDLNCDDGTDGPLLTFMSGQVLYFIAAHDRSTPSSTGTCSPLFLTLQRLRC